MRLVYVLIIIAFGYAPQTKAQTIATFEEFGLEPGQFLNGNDQSGGFSSGNVFLPNDYNAGYDAWRYWAISATTDTITPGFTNQYSAITGSGAESSTTYATTYAIDGTALVLNENAQGGVVQGLYITSSTIGYHSMLDGDAFAKKFGGATGDDPDFLVVIIKKYLNGELSNDSLTFFLADYRFEDNSMDYIVKEWTWLDLTSLGEADSLYFTMTSSDVGMWGMNTPAYFCIDNVTTTDISTSTSNALENTLSVHPNPTSDFINIVSTHNEDIRYVLFNTNGHSLLSGQTTPNMNNIDIRDLPSGLYILNLQTGDKMETHKLVISGN